MNAIFRRGQSPGQRQRLSKGTMPGGGGGGGGGGGKFMMIMHAKNWSL